MCGSEPLLGRSERDVQFRLLDALCWQFLQFLFIINHQFRMMTANLCYPGKKTLHDTR
jgi:hypothetical protein